MKKTKFDKNAFLESTERRGIMKNCDFDSSTPFFLTLGRTIKSRLVSR